MHRVTSVWHSELKRLLLVAPDVVDETISATVMSCGWFVCPQLGLDDLCQCLAQFNTV